MSARTSLRLFRAVQHLIHRELIEDASISAKRGRHEGNMNGCLNSVEVMLGAQASKKAGVQRGRSANSYVGAVALDVRTAS